MALVERVCDRTDPAVFLLQIWVVCFSFAAAASWSDWPSAYLSDPRAFIRLAIPVVFVLIALLIRNGWADPEQPVPKAVTLDISIAMAAAIFSQQILPLLHADFALPRWRATQGSAVGWFFLMGLRAGFPPGPGVSAETGPAMSFEELRCKTSEFVREIRRRNRLAYLVATIASGLFVLPLVLAKLPAIRAGAGLSVVGALAIAWQVRLRGSPGTAPPDAGCRAVNELYRRELDRECLLLRRLLFWYIATVVPGIFLVLSGSGFYEHVALMPVLLVAVLMQHARESVADEVKAVRPSQGF